MVRLVSSVRFRQGARETQPWRRSSVGQSTRLIIVWSSVRVRPPLPQHNKHDHNATSTTQPPNDQTATVGQGPHLVEEHGDGGPVREGNMAKAKFERTKPHVNVG